MEDEQREREKIYIPYMKKFLSPSSFKKFFEKRVFSTIREFGMIKKGDKIAVGYSGGKDSTVLLYLLKKLQRKFPFEMVAITVDINFGEYSRKLVEKAKAFTKSLDIEHIIVDLKKEIGVGIGEIYKAGLPACSYCGVFRRRLLNNAAREIGADKLAIAHNLDDTAQSIIMNIMRNEPLRLLRLIHPLVEEGKFVRRIKPLMKTPEREIVIYSQLNNLPYTPKYCPAMHKAFRHAVREAINHVEKKDPSVKFKILRSFLTMEALMRDGLKYRGEKLEVKRCKICGEPSSEEICMFCKMKEEVRRLLKDRGET